MRKVAQLTPSEIHGVASHLNRLHRPEHGIHWESVEINIYDNGQVYLEWNENQGTPYLTHVPCSELSLTLSMTTCALAVPEAAALDQLTEEQAVRATRNLDEHPEGYDGPCACQTCMSYADCGDEG